LVKVNIYSNIFRLNNILFFRTDNSNICNWIKCENGGICQNIINSTLGYQCRCPFGFTGLLCEDRINKICKKILFYSLKFELSFFILACLKIPCLNNGNCTMINDRIVKCVCSNQYTGVRCETLI